MKSALFNQLACKDRYNWQTQSIMDKFLAFDDDDKDAFFRDARIVNPRNYTNYKGHDIVAECLICFYTGETTGLQCGHKFCRECWGSYLTTKIMEYGEQSIPCADSKCDIIIEDEIVKTLVSDPNVLAKYNRLICNSFVKWKKNLSWCKSPGCNYVIDSFSCTSTFVTCKCGQGFCCECYKDTHAPISCVLLKKWESEDSATQSYLATNTKACPSCHADIEKNGGCPHMVCRNCKHEFCWKCLKPWRGHTSTCNTLEKDLTIRRTRTLDERLKYCWNRYSYNKQSLKDELLRFDVVWEEFENRFEMKNALDIIFKCRNFLMYSYAFIYYLKENNEVYIFEDSLEDLEAKVDTSAVLLEDYIHVKKNTEVFLNREKEIRNKIVQGVSCCDSIRRKWISRVEDGHDKLEDKRPWVYRDEI